MKRWKRRNVFFYVVHEIDLWEVLFSRWSAACLKNQSFWLQHNTNNDFISVSFANYHYIIIYYADLGWCPPVSGVGVGVSVYSLGPRLSNLSWSTRRHVIRNILCTGVFFCTASEGHSAPLILRSWRPQLVNLLLVGITCTSHLVIVEVLEDFQIHLTTPPHT